MRRKLTLGAILTLAVLVVALVVFNFYQSSQVQVREVQIRSLPPQIQDWVEGEKKEKGVFLYWNYSKINDQYRSYVFLNNPQEPQLYQYPTITAKKKGQDVEIYIKDVDASNDDQVKNQLLVVIETEFSPEGFVFFYNGKNIKPTSTMEGPVG